MRMTTLSLATMLLLRLIVSVGVFLKRGALRL